MLSGGDKEASQFDLVVPFLLLQQEPAKAQGRGAEKHQATRQHAAFMDSMIQQWFFAFFFWHAYDRVCPNNRVSNKFIIYYCYRLYNFVWRCQAFGASSATIHVLHSFHSPSVSLSANCIVTPPLSPLQSNSVTYPRAKSAHPPALPFFF